jgi:hypothetical protein
VRSGLQERHQIVDFSRFQRGTERRHVHAAVDEARPGGATMLATPLRDDVLATMEPIRPTAVRGPA